MMRKTLTNLKTKRRKQNLQGRVSPLLFAHGPPQKMRRVRLFFSLTLFALAGMLAAFLALPGRDGVPRRLSSPHPAPGPRLIEPKEYEDQSEDINALRIACRQSIEEVWLLSLSLS